MTAIYLTCLDQTCPQLVETLVKDDFYIDFYIRLDFLLYSLIHLRSTCLELKCSTTAASDHMFSLSRFAQLQGALIHFTSLQLEV